MPWAVQVYWGGIRFWQPDVPHSNSSSQKVGFSDRKAEERAHLHVPRRGGSILWVRDLRGASRLLSTLSQRLLSKIMPVLDLHELWAAVFIIP